MFPDRGQRTEAARILCVTHIVVLGVHLSFGLAARLKMSLFGAFSTHGLKGPALGLSGLPVQSPAVASVVAEATLPLEHQVG